MLNYSSCMFCTVLGSLHQGDARSLKEKLLHMANAYEGRVGRGQTFAFNEHIAAGSPSLSSSLRHCLLFHQALRCVNPIREVDIRLMARARVSLYTDASAERQQDSPFPSLSCAILFWRTPGTAQAAWRSSPRK